MQLRFATGRTSTEYVTQEAWRDATLERCPLHPHGGCSFARHGTYGRVEPPGTRIPRWYCPESHCTFSLLADCFAARLSGTLTEVEAVVRLAEQASSREAAADGLRLDIELPGVLRWLRHRIQPVHLALHLLRGLMLRVSTINDESFFRLFDGTGSTVEGSRQNDAGVEVGRREVWRATSSEVG